MNSSSSKKIVHDDNVIITDILNGNIDAYHILLSKYQSNIRISVKKMIRNYDDVDDLVQEIFIKGFIGLDKYNPEYPFLAWLYRIASNHCIDFLRKKRLKSISLERPYPSENDSRPIQVPDVLHIPDRSLLEKERNLTLHKALDSLPEKYRTVIYLRHFEELEYQDISDKLNIPLGTVKIHLFRARKALNELLSNHKSLFDNV